MVEADAEETSPLATAQHEDREQWWIAVAAQERAARDVDTVAHASSGYSMRSVSCMPDRPGVEGERALEVGGDDRDMAQEHAAHATDAGC